MSILSGAGRTYGFDLDIIKSPSPSSGRSTTSSSSSPSSTISESSNSPLAISAKGARAPRKRPNQSYSEAAALLSTIYPSLFSTKNLHKLTKPFSSLSPSSLSSSDLLLLLPPSPVRNEAGFLIQDSCPNQQPTPLRFEFRPASPSQKSCIEYQEPGSPGSPDYDVESILDEEAGEGIDSIMGHLSMENCVSNSNSSYVINPYLGSLTGFGIGGKAELGFGHALGRNNIRQALRGAHDGDWWRPTTTVPVGDIVPKFNALPPLEKKKKSKKKKKKVEEAVKDEPKVVAAATTKTTKAQVPAEAATATTTPATTTTTCSLDVELKSGLGLKLNHEDVLRAWSDRDFPFTNGSGTPESSADILARLSDIDLIPDSEAGVRGASVQRYREKRRTRLFSKKIRYQVRKVNADCRPRMKGRFVKRPELLQEAIDEESQ